MNYESRIEQDRRVLKAQLSQYAARQVIEHDTAAMAALLAGEGVEHVTMWTDSHGRSHHRSVKS